MTTIVSIQQLCKTYASGFKALKNINLEIKQGEILALLGANGAGKTTLISTICGISNPTAGQITIQGHDSIKDYREARKCIGLVPQELSLGLFETVWNTIKFSRGLFGKKANDAYLETLLKQLSLFDKKNAQIRTLSGGMKRRVLIAKALAHEPEILFLDEPTAGVDVDLRKDMWNIVEKLRQSGVTIILTTHYIEEAEEIADRIGIIKSGELLLIEDKTTLMQTLGKKQLFIELKTPTKHIPDDLKDYQLKCTKEGNHLIYTYETTGDGTGITALLQAIQNSTLVLKDLQIHQSSLEDIFVDLLEHPDIKEKLHQGKPL